jgi:hypothetical protein
MLEVTGMVCPAEGQRESGCGRERQGLEFWSPICATWLSSELLAILRRAKAPVGLWGGETELSEDSTLYLAPLVSDSCSQR